MAKKGQRRKTARRAYEGKGPKRPLTKIIGSRVMGGAKILLVKTPKGERYISGGYYSRKAYGPTYRPFQFRRRK